MLVNQSDNELQLGNRTAGWSSANWNRTFNGVWGKLTEAKFRYYREKKTEAGKVTAVAGDGGHVGLVKPNKTIFWDYEIGGSPHSVEVLPGGMIAVADSAGAGSVKLIGAGSDKPKKTVSQTIPLAKAHGVVWDPTGKLLWAIGDTMIRAYKLNNSKANPKVDKIVKTVKLPNAASSGHDLFQSRATGQGNLLLWTEWRVGTVKKVYGANENPLKVFGGGNWPNINRVKSFSNWTDGRYVVCQGLKGVEYCNKDRAKVLNADGTKAYELGQDGKRYYKVRPFFWVGW